jgi:diguanylate cyclase (GGDEF)-like protein
MTRHRNVSRSLLVIMFLLVVIATLLDVVSIPLEGIWEWDAHAIREGWTLTVDGQVIDTDYSLPSVWRGSPLTGRTVVLSRRITEEIAHANSMMMRASQKAVTVFVDQEMVYRYDGNLGSRRIKIPGYVNHFVWLEGPLVGKELRIETIAHSERTSGTFHEVFLGSRVSQIGALLAYDGFSLVVGLLILMTSAVVALLSLLLFRRLEVFHSALAFAGIEFCAGLWICGGSMSTQLLIHNQLVLLVAGVVAMFLLPVFLTRFVTTMYHIPQSVFLGRIVLIFPVGFIVGSLFQLAGVITYHDMLTPAAIVLLSYLIMLVWFSYSSYRQGNSAVREFLVAIACLLASVIGELILLLLPFMTLLNALVLNMGIIAFGTVLLRQVLMLIMRFVEKKGRDEYLEHLAHTDGLTGLPNRRAFEEHMERLRDTRRQKGIGLVVFDVNDLKKINDEQGHAAGDERLRRIATQLSAWLGHIGSVYRIGGDEFAMICDERDPFAEKLIDERLVAGLDLAFGTARLDEEGGFATIDDVFKAADSRMYRHKAAMKAGFVR